MRCQAVTTNLKQCLNEAHNGRYCGVHDKGTKLQDFNKIKRKGK